MRVVLIVVRPERFERGIITRSLRQRWPRCGDQLAVWPMPAIVWLASFPLEDQLAFGGLAWMIVLDLDDYFNGDDDDRWRRFKVTRNRLRWRMKLPPQPAVR